LVASIVRTPTYVRSMSKKIVYVVKDNFRVWSLSDDINSFVQWCNLLQKHAPKSLTFETQVMTEQEYETCLKNIAAWNKEEHAQNVAIRALNAKRAEKEKRKKSFKLIPGEQNEQ
jgi:hypothetical protein